MNAGDYILQDIGGNQMLLAEVVETVDTVKEIYKVIIRYANEPFYTKYTTTRKSREFKTMPNPNADKIVVVEPANIQATVQQYDMKPVPELS